MQNIIHLRHRPGLPPRPRLLPTPTLALAAGALLTASTTLAAPLPGQLLASQCFQCHGTNGRAVSGFESIAGQPANDMYKKPLELSQRRPENIMDLQARAFTPAQLRLIAWYLSLLPAGPGGFED